MVKNISIEDIVLSISSGTTKERNNTGRYVVYGSTGKIGYSDKYQYSGEKLLIARVGANAGTTNIVAGNYGVSDNTLVLEVKKEHNIKFLYYVLRYRGLSSLLFGSGQPLITGSQLKTVLVPSFSQNEQKKIAETISGVDDLIFTLEKQIVKKNAVKQGVMQELLTGKKRLQGFSDDWRVFQFSEVFDFVSNNAFTRAQMTDSGKVKNIHYGDILTKYGAYVKANSNNIPYIKKEIDLSRFADKCYLQSGDVIIADTAEDETVGKALEVVEVDCPILSGQHTLLCRPRIQFAEKFLGYYLNSSYYHNQLIPYIVGTKVSSVTRASVSLTKLLVPEYEEQKAIASILSDMDDEITELEKKLEKYKQVKQGMMEQLLTGKIRLV